MCVHGDNSRSIEKLLVSDMDAQPSIHTHIQLYMGSSSVPHDRSTATAPSPYGIYIYQTPPIYLRGSTIEKKKVYRLYWLALLSSNACAPYIVTHIEDFRRFSQCDIRRFPFFQIDLSATIYNKEDDRCRYLMAQPICWTLSPTWNQWFFLS